MWIRTKGKCDSSLCPLKHEGLAIPEHSGSSCVCVKEWTADEAHDHTHSTNTMLNSHLDSVSHNPFIPSVSLSVNHLAVPLGNSTSPQCGQSFLLLQKHTSELTRHSLIGTFWASSLILYFLCPYHASTYYTHTQKVGIYLYYNKIYI